MLKKINSETLGGSQHAAMLGQGLPRGTDCSGFCAHSGASNPGSALNPDSLILFWEDCDNAGVQCPEVTSLPERAGVAPGAGRRLARPARPRPLPDIVRYTDFLSQAANPLVRFLDLVLRAA